MGDRLLRARALLASQLEVIVLVLVVVTLAGAVLTYGAHVDPGTTTEQRVTDTWTTTGAYNHSATVSEPNPVYPVGTTLADRGAYLVGIAPVVNGTLVFEYEASDGGNLDITTETRVLVRSVTGDREEPVELWRQSRELERRSVESVTGNSAVRVPFSLDVNRTFNRTERVQERLGDRGGRPRVAVITTVRLTGTVNGRTVNETREYPLGVSLTGDVYSLNATATTDRSEMTEAVAVPREPGAGEAFGGPILFGLGFLGLATLGTIRARKDLSLAPSEEKRLAFEDDREEFAEWIHEIQLPPSARDLPRAQASSLGDLVDFAIDTDSSVLEDPATGVYYVVHDGYLYVYEPSVPDDGPDASTPD